MTISTSTIVKASIATLAVLGTVAAAPALIAAASSITLAEVAGAGAWFAVVGACTALGYAKTKNMVDQAVKNNGMSGLLLPFFAAPIAVGFLGGLMLAAPIATGISAAVSSLV